MSATTLPQPATGILPGLAITALHAGRYSITHVLIEVSRSSPHQQLVCGCSTPLQQERDGSATKRGQAICYRSSDNRRARRHHHVACCGPHDGKGNFKSSTCCGSFPLHRTVRELVCRSPLADCNAGHCASMDSLNTASHAALLMVGRKSYPCVCGTTMLILPVACRFLVILSTFPPI